MAIVISGVNNNDKITAADGTIDLLSGVSYAGIITAPAFTTPGNLTAGHINVGNNIQLGNSGVATATTFVGNLTGNVNATSNLLLQIGGSEKFRVGSSGQFGIGGANYGTSGQVLTSGGSGSAATWSTIPTPDADKIIEGNTKAEVIDSGSDGRFIVETEGTEKFRIDSSGRIFTGGDTQVLNTETGSLHVSGGGTNGSRISIRGTTTSANAGLAEIFAFWDTTKVAGVIAKSGTDTTNKDDGSLHFYTNTGSGISERCIINAGGHFHPHLNSTYDLGISGKAWRNLYVNDAHFSNEGHSNSVDGTWGSWTLQEGENDIFMINNRTGKKYAITMKEVE